MSSFRQRDTSSLWYVLETYNRGDRLSPYHRECAPGKENPYILSLPDETGELKPVGRICPAIKNKIPFEKFNFKVSRLKIYPDFPSIQPKGEPAKWGVLQIDRLNQNLESLWKHIIENEEKLPFWFISDPKQPYTTWPKDCHRSIQISVPLYRYLGLTSHTMHLILYSHTPEDSGTARVGQENRKSKAEEDDLRYKFWLSSLPTNSTTWPNKKEVAVTFTNWMFDQGNPASACKAVTKRAKENIKNIDPHDKKINPNDSFIASFCNFRERGSRLPENYDPTESYCFYVKVPDTWRPEAGGGARQLEQYTLGEVKVALFDKMFVPSCAVVLASFIVRMGLGNNPETDVKVLSECENGLNGYPNFRKDRKKER